MHIVKTDGGAKAEGRGRERADCTVRATAICLGVPYAEAHQRLAALGRKRGCRFPFGTVAAKLGLADRAELSCRRLSTVLPQLGKGRYVVSVSCHVFAVVDGVVHDTFVPKENAHVRLVYEFQAQEKNYAEE